MGSVAIQKGWKKVAIVYLPASPPLLFALPTIRADCPESHLKIQAAPFSHFLIQGRTLFD